MIRDLAELPPQQERRHRDARFIAGLGRLSHESVRTLAQGVALSPRDEVFLAAAAELARREALDA